MKESENSPQNAKKFSWGCMPPNPHSKGSRHAALRHVYPKSQKFESWAPP